jgi:GntR family transcriptional repressor for pyruvate dehydrogenase complex
MLEKLRRATLADQAAARLLELITTRQLQPGEMLPAESRLAADLGVSRQVVREALKSLQGQGVVEIVNGKGASVRSIDASALRVFFSWAAQTRDDTTVELMEVRKAIEVQSARLAAQRRTAAELDRLGGIVARMRDHIEDVEGYTALDVELHLAIAAASHNAMLYHLVESIRDVLEETIRRGLRQRRSREQLERVQVLHEALRDEVQRGDAESAAQAMAQHFDEAVTALADRGAPGSDEPAGVSVQVEPGGGLAVAAGRLGRQ